MNRTYRRSGTLWEGSFKASVVQREEYLLRVYRYVELNPVRAGMVQDPGEYRWSSCRRNGLGKEDGLISEHECYGLLGGGQVQRCQAYRDLFRSELGEAALGEIRSAAMKGAPLGDERFREVSKLGQSRFIGDVWKEVENHEMRDLSSPHSILTCLPPSADGRRGYVPARHKPRREIYVCATGPYTQDWPPRGGGPVRNGLESIGLSFGKGRY